MADPTLTLNEANAKGVRLVEVTGTNIGLLKTSAGGSGGDASAANQTTEISHLNAIKTAVEIMDDWDTGTDRAKVVALGVSGRIIDSDDSTTVITVKTAAGLATASGDNTVIAAVTGKKIRVLSYALQIQSTDDLTACIWQDTSSATQRGMRWMLTGTADGTSMQGVARNAGGDAHYYFETAAGAGLDLNLSEAADVAWEITYVEVD